MTTTTEPTMVPYSVYAETLEQLAQEQEHSKALQRSLQQHRDYEGKIHEVATNKNMSYSDRILWIVMLKNHTKELLQLRPFQPNISRLRQESGVSSDSTTKFLASMHEAKAITYSNKPQQDENHTFSSVSTIIPLPQHTQANTRAATLRIKQRTEVTRRRMARKLIVLPCGNCGSTDETHAYSAIIPICKSCKHVDQERQETILSKNVRIIEEQIIPSTDHEFSEVTDHEYEDDSTSSHEFSEYLTNAPAETSNDITNHEHPDTHTPETHDIPLTEYRDSASKESTNDDTSHEFSELRASIQTEDSTPSHEFSEGMNVSTPAGIGTISRIALINNRWCCRVHLSVKQPDGTYFAAFFLKDVQPVTQTLLL